MRTQRKGSLILPIGVMKLANASTEEVRLMVVILAPCVVWLASLNTSFGDGRDKKGCFVAPCSDCISLAD